MDEHSCYQGDEASLGQQKLRKKQEVGKKKTENKKSFLSPAYSLPLSLFRTPIDKALRGTADKAEWS